MADASLEDLLSELLGKEDAGAPPPGAAAPTETAAPATAAPAAAAVEDSADGLLSELLGGDAAPAEPAGPTSSGAGPSPGSGHSGSVPAPPALATAGDPKVPVPAAGVDGAPAAASADELDALLGDLLGGGAGGNAPATAATDGPGGSSAVASADTLSDFGAVATAGAATAAVGAPLTEAPAVMDARSHVELQQEQPLLEGSQEAQQAEGVLEQQQQDGHDSVQQQQQQQQQPPPPPAALSPQQQPRSPQPPESRVVSPLPPAPVASLQPVPAANVSTPQQSMLTQPPAMGLAPEVDPGLAALEAAEEAETELVGPPPGKAQWEDSVEALTGLLSDAASDWNAQGRPDAAGAMVGGAVLLRLEELSAIVGDLSAWWAAHGRPQAITAAGQFVAVGTSGGGVVVLQLPPAHQTAGGAGGGAAAGAQQQQQAAGSGAAVWALGDGPRPELGAVTALGFSHPAAPQDALWLGVGHAGGVVAVWEIQKRGGKLVATIGTSQLLTADRRGRAVLHTFSSMLLRTTTASRVVLDGQYGPVLGVTHLAPFLMAPQSQQPVVATGSGSVGGGGLPAAVGAPRSPSVGAGGVPEDPTARRTFFEDGAGALRVGEGVVCITTLAHCYVARFKSSGDLLPLYSVPQPGSGTHVPAAAWLPHHRRPGGSGSQARNGVSVPFAVLALAWGPRLVLFNVPLVGDHQGPGSEQAAPPPDVPGSMAALRRQVVSATAGGPTGRAAARQAALDALSPAAAAELTGSFPLSIAGMWRPGQRRQQQQQAADQEAAAAAADGLRRLGPEEALPVLGLHWLDQDVLAAVCQQGLSGTLLVLEGSSLQVREQLQLLDPPVLLEQAPGIGGCGASVAGLGPRVYLLTSQGLSWGRLMPWSERLKTLQDIQKFKLGLHLALGFFKNARQLGPSRLPRSSNPSGGSGAQAAPRPLSGGFARCEGAGAEPAQLEQWLLSLMLLHVGTALHDLAAKKGSEQQQAAAAAGAAIDPEAFALARLALHTCVMLRRPAVLFDRAFPLFAGANAATGALGAFVEAVEPAVVAEVLQGLGPEVMQALVEHFAARGAPERVERCVLHLAITALDLDQVLRLCDAHRLHTASLYVLTRINDHRKAMTDLLGALFAASARGDSEAARGAAMKLLVWVRGAFMGRAYPPGTGLMAATAAQLDTIKTTLLGLILFLSSDDLITDWRRAPPGSAPAEAAAALASGGPAAPSDPHPALRLLLSAEAPATVAVLSEATKGWDAVETDLRAAAGKPAEELERVLVATQVVVNALASLAEGGGLCKEGAAVSLDFVSRLTAAGRVTVRPALAVRLLSHVAARRGAAGEDEFVAVLQAVGVSAPGEPSDPDKFDAQQTQEVLSTAERSGMLRAAAALHHLRGDYSAALSCYLRRPNGEGVFVYAERALSDSSGSSSAAGRAANGGRRAAEQRARFADALLHHVPALVSLDPDATAVLLARRLPDRQLPALRALEQDPERQFAFLRAAFAAQERARAAARQSGRLSQPASPVLGQRAGAVQRAGEGEDEARGQQGLDSPEVVDLHIRLLCRFAPAEVLPFLQGTHAYDVRAAICAASAAGVADAEAYLHERLGDAVAALKLHLREVSARCDAMETALLPGSSNSSGGGDSRRPGKGGSASSSAAAVVLELPPELQAVIDGGTAASSGSGAVEPRIAAAALAAWLRRQLGPAAAGSGGRTSRSGVPAPLALRTLTASGQQQQQTAGPRSSLDVAGAAANGGECDDEAAAAAVVLSRQIRGDVHLRWIAALEPRARIHAAGSRGMGSISPLRVIQPPAPTAAAPVPPPQVAAAWRAAAAAVAFCSRCSRDEGGGGGGTGGGAAGGDEEGRRAAQGAWFALLEAFVDRLRRLKQLHGPGDAGADENTLSSHTQQQEGKQQQQQPSSQDAELFSVLARFEAAADAPPAAAADALVSAASALRAALARRALRDLYAALLDAVVSATADHVPLPDVATRILERHGREAFGEFRATLQGLFAAYAYERAILGAAGALVTKEAFRAVVRARTMRACARHAVVAAAGGGGGGGSGAEDGGDAEAAGDGSGAFDGGGAWAVATGYRLGVLGRGKATGSDATAGGLLGQPPGSGLQVRPPPLLSGGAATAHAAVAQLVATTSAFADALAHAAAAGRPLRGGCDLAAELAAVQEQPVGLGWGHRPGGSSSAGEQQQWRAPADAGAGGDSGDGGGEGAAAASGGSFDIDDMLSWTRSNA